MRIVSQLAIKAINQLHGLGVEGFPIGTEHRKHREKQILDPVHAPSKAARTQWPCNVVMVGEMRLDVGVVSTTKAGRYNGYRHNFRIWEVALWIIAMV